MDRVGGMSGKWDRVLPGNRWRERREALRELFEGIAPSYDRLNRWLSLGIDRSWRRRTTQEVLIDHRGGWILDLASGTGDQAADMMRSDGVRVVRLDLSDLLLRRAVSKLPASGMAPAIVAEMERLPIRPGSLDAVTMAFALRHVESFEVLLGACALALRPGGRLAFVDMSLPEKGLLAKLYRFYFRSCLPRLAVVFGGDRRAYEIMVRSVESFPGWDGLASAARAAGFSGIRAIRLTGGAATLFVAQRPV